MKTTEQITEKRIYLNPAIELIKLDNEISLALQSTPPDGPGEGASLAPEYMNIDPFKTTTT
ncbi:MAG: hypothetical protein ACOYMD_11760 [Paludibacter sp.]